MITIYNDILKGLRTLLGSKVDTLELDRGQLENAKEEKLQNFPVCYVEFEDEIEFVRDNKSYFVEDLEITLNIAVPSLGRSILDLLEEITGTLTDQVLVADGKNVTSRLILHETRLDVKKGPVDIASIVYETSIRIDADRSTYTDKVKPTYDIKYKE